MAKARNVSTESTKLAAVAAETAEPKSEAIITMTTGVVLRVVPPKTRVIYNLYMQNPEPKPPVVSEEMGGKIREFENPDDPDYQAALSAHRTKVYESYVKIIILTSTSIISYPEGMKSFDEDDDWQDELEAIGLPVKEFTNRKERYLEWFFYRVAPTHEDIFLIQNTSEGLVAVSGDSVSAAEETFRNNS